MEPRTPNHLRLPEFSQPLVTALQLAILTVLHDWGLHPRSVVGHSSGEIAASVAAGYLTPEEAIKNAYFRGKAAVDLRKEVGPNLGMLAVGLGTVDVQCYLTNVSGAVRIACVNSPHSVTLSGNAALLEAIQASVVIDGHFARLLKVDLAYHTDFMNDISARYEGLLVDHGETRSPRSGATTMFSSVTGGKVECDIDSCYWQKNMVSPVLFQSAMEEMIKAGDAEFLIEVGPSGALAGPIAQIKKSLGAQGAELEYGTAIKRGVDSVNALFEIAGRIFLLGGSLNMSKVNDYGECFEKPLVITDLPNYAWNHSTKYWHESDASKDWRFKKFPHHDLLGTKILGTLWHTPSWKTILRIDDVPWLKDHKVYRSDAISGMGHTNGMQIGEDIVFPAAGYMAMAIEALYQMGRSLGRIDETSEVFNVSYRFRNVKFLRAMVLEAKADNKLCLSLAPCANPQDSWYTFKISSSRQDVWTEHCCGLIRLQEDIEEGKSHVLFKTFFVAY